ncbi:type I restriction enzyme HsdR N-terminal domain-containing protein [Candidatus Sumerlaeota bacterium]|nr:type I restriction enzyme HsdR N-terminal domain-containing protein [Candidatus Sumerlaeota bacterium]
MNKLIQTIGMIRQKLPSLRRHALKETPTRTIVIDPLLDALGWDVRDPDEVQLECPTVDGKFVDYALKLNRKPVLLVEAKAIDDPLDDVKAITQIVGYAANAGIVWCILTNGIKWRVYRSVEKCPAPDKLMYEVSLDLDESEGMTIEQIAQQLWRLSREETAKGTLDALGEQTFTDGKVRKALHALMNDPPRPLLNLVRANIGDNDLAPQRIKQSLIRIAAESDQSIVSIGSTESKRSKYSRTEQAYRSHRAKKAWKTRSAPDYEDQCNESYHISGKSQETLDLYRGAERFCYSMTSEKIDKRYRKNYIGYFLGERKCFCRIVLLSNRIILRLRLKYTEISNPPVFARDTKGLLHHSPLDFELTISNRIELEQSKDLIRQSFDAVS